MKADWTAQLAADHAPSPAGWWPPAPGWWGVLGVCVLLLLAWLFLRYRRKSRPATAHRNSLRSLRRSALREIDRIERSNADDPVVARALESVLRRFTVAFFGTEQVARLTGAPWLRFLGQHGGALLAGDTGRTLLEAAFAERPHADRASWFRASRQFVERLRNEPG